MSHLKGWPFINPWFFELISYLTKLEVEKVQLILPEYKLKNHRLYDKTSLYTEFERKTRQN